jgi:hypothetical protein
VVAACDAGVSLSSEATAATAARATPIEIIAATDRPGVAGAGAAIGASAGAGAGAASGVAWAKAWPDTKAIMAITEIIFFILKSFSLKILHLQI